MTTKLEVILASIIVILLAVGGFALYERHEGAAKYEAADKALAQQQETHNVALEATQKAQDALARSTLENVPPVDPGGLPGLPASLHASGPRVVPAPRTAATGSDYTPDVRIPGAAALVPPSWADFERHDVQSARDADAEVSYLQRLLKDQYALCSGGG